MSIFFDSFGANNIHAGAEDGFHGVEVFFDFVVFQAVVRLAEGDVNGVICVGIDEFWSFTGAVIFGNFFGG